MTNDKTIFGLRFGLNDELYPTSEELRIFLESPKRDDGQELHRDDLATYSAMIEETQSFEQYERHVAATQDFREQMYYGVLIHTRFFNHALKSAVEQYKYHLHVLTELDFAKPAAFVRSAEEELSKLNPKKKDDAAKLARLHGLVEERKKMLESRKSHWLVLARELTHIATYIRNNLVNIQRLCETSMSVLKDPRTVQNVEKMLTENIKTHFKEHLKDALHGESPVTREYLAAVKKEVDLLLEVAAALVLKDISTLGGLYEEVRDHIRKAVGEIDDLTAKVGNTIFEEDREHFVRLEQVLVSLITNCRFGLKPAKIIGSETSYKNVLVEKRIGVLEHLLDLLKKDRRSWSDRRSSKDRRKFNEAVEKRAEQRSGKDRRSGKNRRQP
jgi:hypothetical protein